MTSATSEDGGGAGEASFEYYLRLCELEILDLAIWRTKLIKKVHENWAAWLCWLRRSLQMNGLYQLWADSKNHAKMSSI